MPETPIHDARIAEVLSGLQTNEAEAIARQAIREIEAN